MFVKFTKIYETKNKNFRGESFLLPSPVFPELWLHCDKDKKYSTINNSSNIPDGSCIYMSEVSVILTTLWTICKYKVLFYKISSMCAEIHKWVFKDAIFDFRLHCASKSDKTSRCKEVKGPLHVKWTNSKNSI